MRSKIEARIQRSPTRKKPKSPVGGKALQRLFFYLGERDPKLNDEIVATTAPPKAAATEVWTDEAEHCGQSPLVLPSARRPRRAAPAAKSLAAAMVKAATATCRTAAKDSCHAPSGEGGGSCRSGGLAIYRTVAGSQWTNLWEQ